MFDQSTWYVYGHSDDVAGAMCPGRGIELEMTTSASSNSHVVFEFLDKDDKGEVVGGLIVRAIYADAPPKADAVWHMMVSRVKDGMSFPDGWSVSVLDSEEMVNDSEYGAIVKIVGPSDIPEARIEETFFPSCK